ncbi:MAG: LysR family transcriptional regulator [Rhodobacter sp.]|nr:LysR family transcriptional regulator [Rhodobacter sp.]
MVTLRLRLSYGSVRFGPGKAELLERIRDSGSISAAGRDMGMSYKRAWMLVEEMNTAFRLPLVDSTRGGAKGGGARLTDAGAAVLAHYRRVVALAEQQGAADIAAIEDLLADIPDEK